MVQNEFLAREYSPKDVYVQTTDRERTILSATSQLDGLYMRQMSFPEPDSLFVLDNIPDSINFLTHLNTDNCPRYKQVIESV